VKGGERINQGRGSENVDIFSLRVVGHLETLFRKKKKKSEHSQKKPIGGGGRIRGSSAQAARKDPTKVRGEKDRP